MQTIILTHNSDLYIFLLMYINISLFLNETDYVLKWRSTKTNGG